MVAEETENDADLMITECSEFLNELLGTMLFDIEDAPAYLMGRFLINEATAQDIVTYWLQANSISAEYKIL